MKEIWKDIRGYEGLYQVSNLGNVRSLNYNRQNKIKNIKAVSNYRGYLKVSLSKNNIIKNKNVHRLVAEAFIVNPNNFPVVNHKDGNKHNNKIINLEWTTKSENTNHAYKNNLMKKNNKAIIQLDKNKNRIKEYKSIKEASLIMKTSPMNIIKCCKGIQNTAKGYVWKYK